MTTPPTRWRVLLVSAALLVAGCTPAAVPQGSAGGSSATARGSGSAVTTRSPGCGRPAPTAAGQDRSYTVAMDPAFAEGETERTAIVHVPRGYRSSSPAPLLMEFHGAGPNATAHGYESGSPMRPLADRAGFLDVFPQGLRYPASGNLGWNAYGPVLVKIAEIPFVDAVLDAVEADYCVDTSRVYASGVSNGGDMVNYVACRDASRFAAVAPVVGNMFGQDDGPCRPARPVPIIDIHSVNDPAVPYGGHPGPPAYDFPLPSVTDWLAGWAQLDGCQVAPAVVAGADGVDKRTWAPCRSGARIVAYATTAGHGWPSVLDGHAAADTVWAFLSSFHL